MFLATHASILTSGRSTRPRGRASPLPERSPTASPRGKARSFGARLSPVVLSAQDHLTSELLRTLQRMAASKPTSWLSR